MKSLKNVCSFVAFFLLAVLLLAGCGGVGSPTSTSTPPSPPGTTPPPPPPPGGGGGGGGGGGSGGGGSPHGTFVYVFNNSFPTRSTSGFRMNSDGTLTALQGSPFSFSGPLAVSGSFLLVSTQSALTSFRIDPASGSLTRAGDAGVAGASVAADAANVYLAGGSADGNNAIFGFSIASDGTLNAVPGSPFFFGKGCDMCDKPFGLALDSRFLFVGGAGFHGVGDATFYTRGQGGVLTNMQALGTTAIERVAIQPAGNVAYGVDQSQGAIVGFTIDASGKPSQGSFTPDDPLALFQDVAIDPSGKFLLAFDQTSNDSRIVVFSINPATSALSKVGAPVSTGEPGGTAIAIDSSGKFVIVAHGAGSAAPNDVMVFSFDPASGALTKVQSASTGPNPGGIVIATL